MISFVTASHNDKILKENLWRSPIIQKYPIIIQKDYSNISKAYNEAKPESIGVIYVHHDCYLPEEFERELLHGIKKVEFIDPNWGVIGIAGVKQIGGKRVFYSNVKDRGTVYNTFKDDTPVEVDTIDELLLITKGDFVFDEKIPGTHFYGCDICLQAKAQGRKNYVINAYVEHNSSLPLNGTRPPDFELCKKYFRDKWEKYLPIVTTCAIVT